MPARPVRLDPSHLPGSHRSRVFLGGRYSDKRPILDNFAQAVSSAGFHPIIADDYQLQIPEHDIHDVTMNLLHSCRLAIFELSELSGALMEIERTVDYGTKCLILYSDPANQGWRVSRMLNSFVEEHAEQMQLRAYNHLPSAIRKLKQWLAAMRRLTYG